MSENQTPEDSQYYETQESESHKLEIAREALGKFLSLAVKIQETIPTNRIEELRNARDYIEREKILGDIIGKELPRTARSYEMFILGSSRSTKLTPHDCIELLRDKASDPNFFDQVVKPCTGSAIWIKDFAEDIIIPLLNSTNPEDPTLEDLLPLIQRTMYYLRYDRSGLIDTASNILLTIQARYSEETRYSEKQLLIYNLAIWFFMGDEHTEKINLKPTYNRTNADYLAHTFFIQHNKNLQAPVTKYIPRRYNIFRGLNIFATIYNSLEPQSAHEFRQTVLNLTDNIIDIEKIAEASKRIRKFKSDILELIKKPIQLFNSKKDPSSEL